MKFLNFILKSYWLIMYNGPNLDLDTRVVDLEENGGGDGNSSVAELEVRVEPLEGTAVDHETRLTTAETDIEGLNIVLNTMQIPLIISECAIFTLFF